MIRKAEFLDGPHWRQHLIPEALPESLRSASTCSKRPRVTASRQRCYQASHHLQKWHYWTLQSHVISANIASLALHKKAGFREVGYRERYGSIGDTWHNVILLERRSKVAGGAGLPTKSCG